MVIAIVLGMLLVGLPPVSPQSAQASHGNIKMPFAAGIDWYVSQGYNTSPAEGWSHYNCDPRTGRDEISGTEGCQAGWQYKYSFDLRRSDGQEAGQPVLSPVDGVIRWVDPAFGGMSIDLGDGYAVAFYHADLARGVAEGQAVRQGQQLGTVAGPGGGGNGGTPHIHLTLWQTDDGGNWSRNAVPFTDRHALDGYDFPALGERVRNQHFNAVVASTNQGGRAAPEPPVADAPTDAEPPTATEPPSDRPRRSGRGGGSGTTPEASPAATAAATATGTTTTPPTTPMPAAPASGTAFAADQAPLLSWDPVAGALEYQVVLNDGERTGPWLAEPSWSAGTLPAGEYRWQVRARNWAGESALWEPWTFSVAAPSAAPRAAEGGGAAATPVADGADDPAPDALRAATASPDARTPTTSAETTTPLADAVPTPTTAPMLDVDAAPPGAEPTVLAPTSATSAPTAAPTTPVPTASVEAAPAVPTAVGDVGREGDDLTPREQAAAAAAYDKANDLREQYGLAPLEIPVAIAPAIAPAEETETTATDEAAGQDPVVGAAQEVGPATEERRTARRNRDGGRRTEDGVGGPSDAPAPAEDAATLAEVDLAASGEEATSSEVEPTPTASEPAVPQPTEAPPVVDDQAGADGIARTSNEPGTRRERREATATPEPAGDDAAAPEAPDADAATDTVPADAGSGDGSASVSAPPTPISAEDPMPDPVPTEAAAPTTELAAAPDSPTEDASPTAAVVVAPAPEDAPVPPTEPEPSPGAEAPPIVDPTPVPETALVSDPALAPAPTSDAALAVDPALVVDATLATDVALAPTADPVLPELEQVLPEPEPEPEPVPDPVAATEPQQMVFGPVADTSVMAIAPDAVQAAEQVGMLPTGGSVGAVAYVTFQVAGVAAGSVLDAQLVLTGTGDVAGPGGLLGALPGAWVDEAATFATAPPASAPALTAAGAASSVDWLQPGVETAVDVSGTVTADGLVTFVVTGSPEAMAAIASRESPTPPRLVLTVRALAASQDHFSG